jgi:hypothetical protein
MLGFPMTSHPCHACADAESSRASRCRGIRVQLPRSIPSADPSGRDRIACRKEAPPWSSPHAGTADKSRTKTWWRRLDSSPSHIAKLCERLPVSECRPRLAPINFQASGTPSNGRRTTLTRIQQFSVTFLTLSTRVVSLSTQVEFRTHRRCC